ncbi:AEX-3 domain-containing protein [Calycina marina]|uniref:AEX-3 domain-containing protein n=1 Tax=Calycina marina TaxID=1763456 RepID=A0A9P8CHA0_9HELO|nr:AEX-3 domain-containing protein [Calycina marina]
MDTSAPLADYFWIAGVDSLSYEDYGFGKFSTTNGTSPSAPPVDETIEEGSEGETVASPSTATADALRGGARHSRNNSWNRLSKLSRDARSSIQSLEELNTPNSNRSSMTIKAPINGAGGGPTDSDFESMVMKLAEDRENFLEDLSFSAGAITQPRPPMTNPRADRIRIEDNETATGRRSPLRSVAGSMRRRISLRDMSSMKRQPSMQRNVSTRTSKRLSNYESVVPRPEPLKLDPNMHPLKRCFEPVLLDRYPPKHAIEEVKRRGKFPDFVPMFAFPNDINIISSDMRPKSTWHGFMMTDQDNTKVYGITVIVWIPLTQDAAADVEQRCEQWRQDHMSPEEREFAADLGHKLAIERARLSELLTTLPTVASESEEREALDDEISVVEERITVWADILRPVRHGAASRIDGLTDDGATGLWKPRAYGILGRDPSLTSFWKEWLRAVVVPMTDGGVLRVPPSSPKVGRWQPLERYVVNLCTEALSPISSKTQVELAVRELRLFARKEAVNELPQSRATDLYALFRCLSIPNIVALFEFVLTEQRIILISSHTAMLHLACKAIVSSIYPLKWQSLLVPVLPARLMTILDAPCPYICGIERRYENIAWPDDEYVLVDLDADCITAMEEPFALPRQQRRKLVSLLQLAAPHHNKFGVKHGPPPYAQETFPYDAFSTENDSVFTQNAQPGSLGKYASQNSTTFGEIDSTTAKRNSVFNAFLQSKNDHTRVERPSTSNTSKVSPEPSLSPISGEFPRLPSTPMSRNDSGFALSATLREKRSGHFDTKSRRSSSFGLDRNPLRRPSVPFVNGHSVSHSTSALSTDSQSVFGYAPSTYAASTLAASTIMPSMLMEAVQDTDDTIWVEGHRFEWHPLSGPSVCSICDEKPDGDGLFKCHSCPTVAHTRCLGVVSLVCPAAFHPDRIRAAFVRTFASLLYTYRKYMGSPTKEQRKGGQIYAFDMNGFVKSLPAEQAAYITKLRDTQAFNEFIYEREITAASDPVIQLFDAVILTKKGRGRSSFFTPKSSRTGGFLEDKSDHLWRSAAVPTPSAKIPGDYRTVVSRVPAQLDVTLMKEPRTIQGVPRIDVPGKQVHRKAIPSLLGLGGRGN